MSFLDFYYSDNPTDSSKRISKAAKADITPLPGSLDAVNKCAKFRGEHGTYTATLESCGCGDFLRRRFPCKHMYRLAHELEIIHIENVASDAKQIKAVKPTTTQRADAVSFCENVINRSTEESALALKNLLSYRHAHATKNQPYPCSDCKPLQPFFDAGMIAFADCPDIILTAFGKKATVNAAIAAGYSFPADLKKTISARFDYCLAHAAQIQPIVCPEWCVIVPTDILLTAHEKTYHYLNRLFPSELVFYY